MMHLLVFHELHKMRVNNELEISAITPEKSVLLESRGIKKKGRLDFFVQTKRKKIGIEVLTRPTQGKMKEKLSYVHNVDEFFFVLPKDSFGLYKKPVRKGHSQARPCCFDSEFNSPKLKVWLVDLAIAKITAKTSFNRIFNVK